MKQRTGLRMTFALAAAVAAIGALAQRDYLKDPITVFDFGMPEDLALEEGFDPAALLRLGIMDRLSRTDRFQPLTFSIRSASVQYALEERRLTLEQVEPPFNTPEGASWRAVVVGKQLRTSYALAGSIEAYSYDAQKHSGSVVVSVDVFDVNEDKILVSAAVTGNAQGTGESTEVEVMSQAIDNAATLIMDEVKEPLGIGRTSVLESAGAERRKQMSSKLSRSAFYVAAAGILIALLTLSRD